MFSTKTYLKPAYTVLMRNHAHDGSPGPGFVHGKIELFMKQIIQFHESVQLTGIQSNFLLFQIVVQVGDGSTVSVFDCFFENPGFYVETDKHTLFNSVQINQGNRTGFLRMNIDEFGFFEDYEEITLTYYADDILADDQDRIIEDKESIIGRDALSRLTNTDDETVYVRNEKLKVDYEICYDYKRFAEVMDEQPEGYANG